MLFITLKLLVQINEERRNLQLPGPGAYTPKAAISDLGSYFNSKYQNSRASITPKAIRFRPEAYSIRLHRKN